MLFTAQDLRASHQNKSYEGSWWHLGEQMQSHILIWNDLLQVDQCRLNENKLQWKKSGSLKWAHCNSLKARYQTERLEWRAGSNYTSVKNPEVIVLCPIVNVGSQQRVAKGFVNKTSSFRKPHQFGWVQILPLSPKKTWVERGPFHGQKDRARWGLGFQVKIPLKRPPHGEHVQNL